MNKLKLIRFIKHWNESEITNLIKNGEILNDTLINLVKQYNSSKLEHLYFLIRQHEIDAFKAVNFNVDYTSNYFSEFIENISIYIERYTKRGQRQEIIKSIEERETLVENTICDCAICLDFEKKTSVITLQCNHRFHWFCLQKWFSENLNCPMCKSECI